MTLSSQGVRKRRVIATLRQTRNKKMSEQLRRALRVPETQTTTVTQVNTVSTGHLFNISVNQYTRAAANEARKPVNIDIAKIIRAIPNAQSKTPGERDVNIPLTNPNSACHVYSSGKCVMTGARSTMHAIYNLQRVAGIIQSTDQNVRLCRVEARNFVYSIALPYHVNLSVLKSLIGLSAVYKPGSFPGLSITVACNYSGQRVTRIVVTVFASGKINVTGCKTKDEAFERYREVYAEIYAAQENKNGDVVFAKQLRPFIQSNTGTSMQEIKRQRTQIKSYLLGASSNNNKLLPQPSATETGTVDVASEVEEAMAEKQSPKKRARKSAFAESSSSSS